MARIVLSFLRATSAAEGRPEMPEPAEEVVIRNLIEALDRLHQDLDRVELWTAVLHSFQHPAPQYQPKGEYILPPGPPL
jgi:hypothetical protein